MYHQLVDLYQVCLNNDPCQKWPHPWAYQIYIDLYRKTIKFFSETTKSRALMFGMYYQLMALYQVCLNYDPGPKMAQSRGLFYFWAQKVFLLWCL